MRTLKHSLAWWRTLGREAKRDDDERTRLIQLLAMRDAFVAVSALVVAGVAVSLFVADDRIARVAPDLLVWLPVGGFLVAGITMWRSWLVRGGTYGRATVIRIGIVAIVGVALGNVTVLALSRADVIDRQVARDFPSVFVAQLIGVSVVIALSARRTRRER